MFLYFNQLSFSQHWKGREFNLFKISCFSLTFFYLSHASVLLCIDNFQAISLTKEICKNVDSAAKTIEGINYTVILRGDSTLRGHFPEASTELFYGQFFILPIWLIFFWICCLGTENWSLQEAEAVVSVLGEMDAWIICPFFLQGGRYTIDDIHYVADSERLTVNLHTQTRI